MFFQYYERCSTKREQTPHQASSGRLQEVKNNGKTKYNCQAKNWWQSLMAFTRGSDYSLDGFDCMQNFGVLDHEMVDYEKWFYHTLFSFLLLLIFPIL